MLNYFIRFLFLFLFYFIDLFLINKFAILTESFVFNLFAEFLKFNQPQH